MDLSSRPRRPPCRSCESCSTNSNHPHGKNHVGCKYVVLRRTSRCSAVSVVPRQPRPNAVHRTQRVSELTVDAPSGAHQRLWFLDLLASRWRKANVERAQVGLQTGILNGNDPCLFSRIVVVRMPHARWRHECRMRLPVDANRVDDLVILIKLTAD